MRRLPISWVHGHVGVGRTIRRIEAIVSKGHHLARGCRRHGVAVASACTMTMLAVGVEVAIGAATGRRRERIASRRRERVLITIRIASIGHNGAGRWTAGKWIGREGWVGHDTRRIPARGMVRNMGPLRAGVMRRPTAGPVARVVVVAVQTVRMDGLWPSPSRPLLARQCVSAP